MKAPLQTNSWSGLSDYASYRAAIRAQLKAAVLLYAACAVPADAQDISFRDAFNAAIKQDVIAISVAQDDILVFESGEYYTSGRNIIISAQRARVTGTVRLGFYPPSEQPNPVPGVAGQGKTGDNGADSSCGHNGCVGHDGNTGDTGVSGETGASGAAIFVNVITLSGDGTLMLINAGQMGGKGQQGGLGGSGGKGGAGAERSCGGWLGLDTRRGPGNGGNGGRGGDGGKGGSGGMGGEGGTITVSASLADAFQAGLIRFDITPANGGQGGEGGDAGGKGVFGTMGGGNSCGGGGDNGISGSPGNRGSNGDEGRKGSTGTIQYLRQDGSLVSASTCLLSTITSCPSLDQGN